MGEKFYLDKDNRAVYQSEVKKGDTVKISRRYWVRVCKQYKHLPCESKVSKVTQEFFHACGFKFILTPNQGGGYFNP